MIKMSMTLTGPWKTLPQALQQRLVPAIHSELMVFLRQFSSEVADTSVKGINRKGDFGISWTGPVERGPSPHLPLYPMITRMAFNTRVTTMKSRWKNKYKSELAAGRIIPLVDTGAMRDSITSMVTDSEVSPLKANGQALVGVFKNFVNNTNLARTHELGGLSVFRGKTYVIPARPFLRPALAFCIKTSLVTKLTAAITKGFKKVRF